MPCGLLNGCQHFGDILMTSFSG